MSERHNSASLPSGPQPPTPNPLSPALDALHSKGDPQHPVPCALRPKLLIVEDNEILSKQMKWALEPDYEVFLAGDRPGALEIVKGEKPAVVTLDLGLPPEPGGVEEGFLAISNILEQAGWVKIIVITGQGEKENALKAVSRGAYDFFLKPVRMDEIKVVLRRAFYLSRVEAENRELQQRVNGQGFESMLGTSPNMLEVFSAIRKVAPTKASVLIRGESGTGKELVARAIHRLSGRGECPFVVINCGAIPEHLLESELFGHEKGAFTGAHIQRTGRVEAANGGTLFLDEIGELPLALQVKLLRFLQEHRIERVGGRAEIRVDARFLAATNTDLKHAISEGRFREDLYFRIAVVNIEVPPLRERGEDVLLMANSFLQKYAAENNKKITGLTAEALRVLEMHTWPGNVRELENRINRAVIMAENSRITRKDLELSAYARFEGRGLKEAREAFEKELIWWVLRKNKGRVTSAAEELKISRTALYELIEKLGIRKEGGRE
jgi:two-component system NtrC family response regulator